MTINFRVVSKLEIKGPNVVKGIQMEGLKVIDLVDQLSKYYYENNADELIITDVVASLYKRKNSYEVIQKLSKDILIPITVSGGIKNLDDINKILKSGADKVAINTGALENHNFIKKAVKEFGSSTISILVDALFLENEYETMKNFGRDIGGIKVRKWIDILNNYDVGEIILNSVDNDGTAKGFDKNLIQSIDFIEKPLIVSGGFGKLEHLDFLVDNPNISGFAASSIFHNNYLSKNKKLNKYQFSIEGNIEITNNSTIHDVGLSINEIKSYLKKINSKRENITIHE